MAIALGSGNVGTVDDTNGGTTLTVVTTAPIPAGALVVIGWGHAAESVTTSGIAGGGASWQIDRDAGRPAGGIFDHVGMGSCIAPGGGIATSTNIVITTTGDFLVGVAGVSYFTGTETSSYVDVAAAAVNDDGAGGYSVSATIAAGSVLVGTYWQESSVTASSHTAGVGSAELWEKGTDYGGAAVYRIEPSAGTYAVSGDFPTGQGVAVAVAYKAAADAEWPPVDNPAAPPLRVARSNLRLG